MTYQELLEEFDNHRQLALQESEPTQTQAMIQTLEWAIQSILEKLRDGDKT